MIYPADRLTAIDINLRLPAMVRGKKGFERVVWALSNVLNHSVTWLFYDLKAPNDGTGPISAHQPTLRSVEPETVTLRDALVPDFSAALVQDESEDATAMLEWLSLACNLSPRLQNDDSIDLYLCRYRVPHTTSYADALSSTSPKDLVRFHWHGFMPSGFITKVLLAVMKASGDRWFGLSAQSFSGHAYTVLESGGRILTWEYAD